MIGAALGGGIVAGIILLFGILWLFLLFIGYIGKIGRSNNPKPSKKSTYTYVSYEEMSRRHTRIGLSIIAAIGALIFLATLEN